MVLEVTRFTLTFHVHSYFFLLRCNNLCKMIIYKTIDVKYFTQDFQNYFPQNRNHGTIKILKLNKISAKKNFYQNYW